MKIRLKNDVVVVSKKPSGKKGIKDTKVSKVIHRKGDVVEVKRLWRGHAIIAIPGKGMDVERVIFDFIVVDV